VSRRPNTRFGDLKIRDYVDINPVQRHLGWRVGQIRRMDKYSGQAQIVYKEEGQEFLYWAHLNNPREIAPFMTRAAETIALQQKIAEFNEDENDAQVVHQALEDVGSPEDMSGNVNVNPLHGKALRANKAYTANTFNTGNTQTTQNTQNTVTTQNTQTTVSSAAPRQQGQAVQGQFDGVQMGAQPPSAHGLGIAPQMAHKAYGGRPSGAGHSKRMSRVLPKTIKNKKLPPKPSKSPRKRNVNVDRSRTQPLPDNRIQNIHQSQQRQSNGYANQNQNQNGYARAQQQPNGYAQPNGQSPQNGYAAPNGNGNGNGYGSNAMHPQPQPQSQHNGQYPKQQRSASQQQPQPQYNMPNQQPPMKQNGYTAQW